MDFAFDARTEELRENLQDFVTTEIDPVQDLFQEQLAGMDDHWAWSQTPILNELRAEARSAGSGTCSFPVRMVPA